MSLGAGGVPILVVADRPLGNSQVVLLGLAWGALCYLLAEFSTPSAVTSSEQHDLWLVQRLGFILAPTLALWLGWLQRSWRRALIGGAWGLLVGWVCSELCWSAAQPIRPALPIVLGGVFAAFCGSRSSDWLPGLAGRLAKGLLVGLLIGLVYTDLLSLGALAFWPGVGNVDYTGAHVRMMWRAGPLALAVSGAMLLPASRWAARLARPRASLRGAGSASPLAETVRHP